MIKLGALGDFVQASLAMDAIAKAHSGDDLTLLTTPAFASLGEAYGHFKEIWTDGRPKGIGAHLKLIARLRKAGFERVYDLQTSSRSSWYFQTLRPGAPEWSGVAAGCSHPHANPNRVAMHTVDRQAEQLAALGIEVPRKGVDGLPVPDLSGLPTAAGATIDRFNLSRPFALIVPGGAPHRPAKRWPAAQYGELAQHLIQEGLLPVLIGAKAEEGLVSEILAECPDIASLVGQTSFLDIVALGSQAALAIGNDTGPMHLLASAGAPSLVLFSHESDPARCAPRGRQVVVRRVPDLRDLSVSEVIAAISGLRGDD